MTRTLANAVGAKAARACDSCVKRRARWYCGADDAFLCQSCDGSVHSANPLARRHERVRLKSANGGRKRRLASSSSPPHAHAATWLKGFTRKARTPRGGMKSRTMIFHDLVPEMSMEDQTESYDKVAEEQLIYQVPVLSLPMVDEQCMELPRVSFKNKDEEEEEDNGESCLNGLFPTDMELAQFTADVETLLGGGVDREFINAMEEGEMLKVEKEEEVETNKVCDLDEAYDESSPFEISFDFEYTHKKTTEEEEEDVMNNNIVGVGVNEMSGRIKEEKEEEEKILMLRLDYESVISTWGGQGTPWTALEPSHIDLDKLCLPTDAMGERGGEAHLHHNHFLGLRLRMREGGEGGREARVSRYREKRRTRLFSKKIRYEVRKLNAEKRPRMKGRFVKRSSLTAETS